MTDFLTVLTCTPGHRCAKLYTDPAQKPEPYNAGFLFGAEQVPVNSLAELAEALDSLRAMPDAMVIRDRLRPDAKPAPNGLFARRRVDRPNDPAPFEAAEHSWAMFDADTTASAFDPKDPVGSVEAWRALLPAALRTAAMVFQFSASQHLSANVRGHAWVWLAEPLGGVPLARWSSRNGLDPAVFHAVQPLYTADPIFAEGTADPLAPRWLVVLEGNEAVELDLTEQDHIEGALLSQNGQRLGSIHLAEVGDPSLEPEAVDARARVVKQFEGAFSGPGKRWELCGHIGGACANVGAPPEECCAILEGLRASDVPDHEFAAGLQWALGAYSFSARPMGLKGVSLLCGPVVSIAVGNSLRVLGEIYREPTPEEEAAANAPAPTWGTLPIEGFSLETEPEPIDYVIEGLQLGPGKPTALVGYANASKTPFALELAVHVASPKLAKFQGHAITRHVKALVLVTEGARNSRRKLGKICKGHGVALGSLAGLLEFAQAPPGFLDVEAAAELGERAIAGGFKLVVIDTYNSAFDGSKDRNSNEFSMALKVLGDISDRADITFLVLLHCRKSDKTSKGKAPTLQDIDGHNSIAGAVQSAIGLWRRDDELKRQISVQCVREVDEAFDTYTIDWVDVAGSGGEGMRAEVVELDASSTTPSTAARDEAEAVAQLLALVDAEGFLTERAAKRDGMPSLAPTARQAVINGLVRSGALVREPAGRGSFRLVRAPRSPKSAEALAKHAGAGFLGPPQEKVRGAGRYLDGGRRPW